MSENENKELEQNIQEAPKAPAKAEKADKADKAKKTVKTSEKKKKPGVGQRFSRFLREMKSELKKVSWPTRNQTFKNTLVVIACVLIVGIFVWVFDAIASGLINALINLFGH